jgi:hypothetical protein
MPKILFILPLIALAANIYLSVWHYLEIHKLRNTEPTSKIQSIPILDGTATIMRVLRNMRTIN